MTLLSIITVCYNSKTTIAETIESVLSQSFKNYEYIVIDGGSTDGTVDIIKKYKSKFGGRLSYVSEKDKGVYNAMNKGIKKAKGKWIHLLNSDDTYMHQESLEVIFKDEKQIQSLDHYDWILSNVELKGRVLKPIRDAGHYSVPHPGMLVRKVFYSRNGFYPEKFSIISDAVFINSFIYKAKYILLDSSFVSMKARGLSDRLTLLRLKEYAFFLLNYNRASLIIKIILFLNVFTRINLVKQLKLCSHFEFENSKLKKINA